jgi:hypothetical protein
MKFELEPDNRGAADSVILDDLRAVARKLGKDYVTKDEYNEHGRWSAATLQKRFGSWCKAHELAGLRNIRHFDTTAEDCVADIQRVAKALGKTTLSQSEYRQNGNFSVELVVRRCGSWVAALAQAGLTASPQYHKRATDEQLFENLERIWEALGRQPKRRDFEKPLSKYGYDAYTRRFGGSFRKALEAFVASLDNRESGHSDEPPVEAANDTSPVPTAKRHRTSRSIGWRMRFLVARRDDFKCRMCGASPALKPGTLDHIVPWAAGGETVMENLQTACEPCNGGKSDLPMHAE